MLPAILAVVEAAGGSRLRGSRNEPGTQMSCSAVAALAAACGESEGVRPSPSLAFSDSAIGFCYSPATVRNCVRLAQHVLFTSTGASLAWKAISSKPWIVIQPATGSSDMDVRVSVDLTKLPPRNGATSLTGSLTVSASGAKKSPRTSPVKLQFSSSPPPE
jgi:hypothetical protein